MEKIVSQVRQDVTAALGALPVAIGQAFHNPNPVPSVGTFVRTPLCANINTLLDFSSKSSCKYYEQAMKLLFGSEPKFNVELDGSKTSSSYSQ